MSDAVKRVHMHGSDSLQVEGQDELLVYRARCCNPIRGEEIVGYVTRGKGVAVHARGCPNVQNLLYESDRRISVEWARMAEENARPQDDLSGQVDCLLRRSRRHAEGDDGGHQRRRHEYPRSGFQADGDSEAVVEFVLEAEDMRHLTRIVSGLRRVPGVRDVQRAHKVVKHGKIRA